MSKKTLVRSYSAKVKKCPEWEYLLNTHKAYNEGLGFVMGKLFEMKNGRLGENYKKVFEYVLQKPQYAHAFLNPLTDAKFRPSKSLSNPTHKNHEIALLMDGMKKNGDLLFDRHKHFPGMSAEMCIKLFQFSTAKMKSHVELVSKWEKDKVEWTSIRSQWLEENPEYAKAKPLFDEFEERHGKFVAPKRKKGTNEYTYPDGTTVNLDKMEDKELGISSDSVFQP